MDINWRERIKKGMLEYANKWALPFTEENVMGFIKRCQKAQGYPLFTTLDKFYRCSCFGGEPITPGTIYFKDVPKEVADVLRVTVNRYDWLAHYFKTGKIAPHSSNVIIELDPSKENLERVEAQIKEASPDEQEKLLIFINNTRRTLGMPDYEDETSNESEPNPETNLTELVNSFKTNPNGLAGAIEEEISPELKEKFANIIRERLERSGMIEAIDWERNVSDILERCEKAGGIPMFRTRYASERFEDKQNPGKYLVLFICYGKRISQWLGNVSKEDVERLEAD